MLACALACLPGCSWIAVAGPPPDHVQRTDFTCTASQGVPVVDTVFATMFGVLAGAVAFEESGQTTRTDQLLFGLILVAPAALFAGSAITGYADVADCRDALDAVYQRQLLAQQAGSVVIAPPPATPAPAATQPTAPTDAVAPQEAPVLLFAEPPSDPVPEPAAPPMTPPPP